MKFPKHSVIPGVFGLVGLIGSAFVITSCTGAGDKDVIVTEEDRTPGLVGPGGKGPAMMTQPEDITVDGSMSQVEGDEPDPTQAHTPEEDQQGARVDRPNLTPEAEVIEPGGPANRESVAGQQQLAEVQAELRKLGYYDGPIDGVLSRQTQQALREFQMAQGIQVSGQVNPSTLQALGLA